MEKELSIRPLRPADWPAVRRIYAEGMATGNATFETACPTWEAWDRAHLPVCRLAAVRDGTLVGWGALSPVSARPVYAGVAEMSVYVAADCRGEGIGRALFLSLIAASEQAGLWTLQSAVLEENRASLHLHDALGFRRVGFRERIARDAQGVWRNTVLLERRSPVVGSADGQGASLG